MLTGPSSFAPGLCVCWALEVPRERLQLRSGAGSAALSSSAAPRPLPTRSVLQQVLGLVLGFSAQSLLSTKTKFPLTGSGLLVPVISIQLSAAKAKHSGLPGPVGTRGTKGRPPWSSLWSIPSLLDTQWRARFPFPLKLRVSSLL